MNTHAIATATATLGRLRDVIDQPTPAGFDTGLKALYSWAEQPARIVPVSATLTALITDTAELLGDQALWIEDAGIPGSPGSPSTAQPDSPGALRGGHAGGGAGRWLGLG